MLTLPLNTRLLLSSQNYSLFLSRMTKGKSLRSGHFLIIGRTIILILIIIIITGAIITSSSEARGDGKGGAMKPPRQAWRHAIWTHRLKLGLTPSNRRRANGTHNGEERRLEIRDRKMTNDPCDSRREDELIIGRRISIDINERDNEMRRKVYSEVL